MMEDAELVHYKFRIGDEVYNKSRNQNGVVQLRKHLQSKENAEITYQVCYRKGEGGCEYEWDVGNWLEKGHKDIID